MVRFTGFLFPHCPHLSTKFIFLAIFKQTIAIRRKNSNGFANGRWLIVAHNSSPYHCAIDRLTDWLSAPLYGGIDRVHVLSMSFAYYQTANAECNSTEWRRCTEHTNMFETMILCQIQNQSNNKCSFVKQMPIFKVSKIIQSTESGV